MQERREALYCFYSWEQPPLNSRKRVNSPEGEKEIFDKWFEETANEYYEWTKNQGLDNETIRANASWALSPPPIDPEVYRALVNVSPKTLERLKQPKKDRKTLEEEARKEAERLASIKRYERCLTETRKAINKIKQEKERKRTNSHTQDEGPSSAVVVGKRPVCRALSELSPFRRKPQNRQATTAVQENKPGSEQPKEPKSHPTRCSSGSGHGIEKGKKHTDSCKLEQKNRTFDANDDSDSELLRLELESSPVLKPKSQKRCVGDEDELSDEALLALMTSSSPVSTPKNDKWSVRSSQSLPTQCIVTFNVKKSSLRPKIGK